MDSISPPSTFTDRAEPTVGVRFTGGFRLEACRAFRRGGNIAWLGDDLGRVGVGDSCQAQAQAKAKAKDLCQARRGDWNSFHKMNGLEA